MSDHLIYNKRKLCFTEVSDFTDFQGIGSDPLYKRFDSVKAVMRTCIDERYQGFLAQPIYDSNEDVIEWYVDEWEEHPRRLTDLVGEERERYQRIKEETVQHYRNAALKLENEDLMILGGVLKYTPDDTVFCYDGKVVLLCWGMRYDTNKHKDVGSLMHAIPQKPKPPTYFQVRFMPGPLGSVEGNGVVNLREGESITAGMIPAVTPADGYHFTGWDAEPLGLTVSGDMVFNAKYERDEPEPVPDPEPKEPKEPEEPEIPLTHNVRFDAGGHGKLKGPTSHNIPADSAITAGMVPKVKSKWRYKFTGWDADPLTTAINGDTVFTAQYEKRKGFAAIWPWLWKLLLALLLLLLLFLLLQTCGTCHRTPAVVPIDGIDDREWVGEDPNVGNGGGIYDPGNPYTPVPTPPGYEDVLPPNQGVLPPIKDDDPIREEPGQPRIIANRLNVLMENDDKSIMDLARDFKQKYPGDQYQVVYYDDVVKRMQIVVPEAEREAMKERLPQEFAPEYTLFVFDESLFEGVYKPSDPDMSSAGKTWYLTAINAFSAWETTTGSEEVTVAVVDNGFNLGHKEFKDKIVMPYNVWNHDARIAPTPPADHGTHVAGTAIALANNGTGLCGIAPKCKFMPVQVADAKGRMTITSVLDGVIYAIYQGADVINISLGGSFSGLDQYPERLQRELINNHFKEEERLWNEVSRIAETHKVIIVAAAGNDNILAGVEAMQRPKNIIIVAAVDKNNRQQGKADFSNYGEYSTVSAPGVDIYSSYERGYRSLDGTSMASPIVAGAVALMKSVNRNITAEQAICILQSTGKTVNGDIGPMIQLDKAILKVKNNELNDCTQAVPPTPSHGDVEITMHWNNRNDLDLICVDPNNETIYFNHRNARSGGKLEIDMNVSGESDQPIEHIYWPTGGAPNGTYIVGVHYHKNHVREANETPFTINVKYGGRTETYTGSIKKSDDDQTICSFTLGSSGSRRDNVGNGSDAAQQQLIERRDQLQRELDEINRALRNQNQR